MDYSAKNHAKFLILYHLIFVCKYRKKLLILYGDEVKTLFEEIAARSDFSGCHPGSGSRPYSLSGEKRTSDFTASDCTQTRNRESTFQLWKRHQADLKKEYWEERTFWSDGYFCCTIGNASKETVRQYIESQG